MSMNDKPGIQNLSVLKGYEYVHISNREISLIQRRLINVLLLNAYDNLLKDEVHFIEVGVLMDLIDFNSNNTEVLKSALRGLVDIKFEWDMLGEDGREKEWGVAAALSQARIMGTVVQYAYAPAIRDKLYNPDIYARIKLQTQNKFESKFGMALWETCLSYTEEKETPWIPLETMRALIGTQNAMATEFKFFNRDCLKPAIDEVNSVSDITITPELKRIGRKVAYIRFAITEKAQASLDLERQDNEIFDKKDMSRLADFGFTEDQSRNYCAMRSSEYINNVLDYVEAKVNDGKVDPKKVTGYAAKALREGWVAKDNKFTKANKEREERETNKENEEQSLREERRAFSKYRSERIRSVLSKLDEKELVELEKSFFDHVQRDNKLVASLYKQSGISGSNIVKNAFNLFVGTLLLTKPEDRDFDAFVESRKRKLAGKAAAAVMSGKI